MKIEKIYTYPVKALRAVELNSVEVTRHGFPHDRRFMILEVAKNEDGSVKYNNIHVAEYPSSVLLHPTLDVAREVVTITYKPPHGKGKETTMDFPLYPETEDLEVIEVDMHKSPTKCFKMPRQHNDWLSQCYGFEAVLAYLGPNYRKVLMSASHEDRINGLQKKAQSNGNANGWLSSISSITSTASSYIMGSNKTPAQVTFADCAPYLIASSRSMDDLQTRLPAGSHMEIIKFRPNIIVSGAEDPWDEDYWGQITIAGSGDKETKIECVHNCGRCKSINIDYETGTPGEGPTGEMLKKMQKDRRVDKGAKWSPIFGRYSFLGEGSEGNVIKVGDAVVVSRRLEETTTFDWPGIATS